MSKIAIQGDPSGTGTLTIAAPNTNSNYTLTLPTASGTLASTGSQPAFASTIGVGGATPAASGAGITFPATQSASSDANTLDDYEEGTWTPTLEGSTDSSGNTYTTQAGTYVKVGTLVVCTAAIIINSWGTNTGGVAFVKGLPFTTGASVFPITTVGWDLLNGNYVNIQAYANPSATFLHLIGATAAAATSFTFVPPTSIKNASSIYLTFTYRAA